MLTLLCFANVIFFHSYSFPTETFQRSSAIWQGVWASEPFGKRLLWANIQRHRKPKGKPQNCCWSLGCGCQSFPETSPRQLQTVQNFFWFSLPRSIDITWAIVFCKCLSRAFPMFPWLPSVLTIYDMKEVNPIAGSLSSMIYFITARDESQIYIHRYTTKHIILKYGFIILWLGYR